MFILLYYKQIIRPPILYTVPVCGQFSMTHITKIQVLQSKVLQGILYTPWFVRNDKLQFLNYQY